MTLRTRLLLGYGFLLVLLVVTGGAGVFGFREINGLVQRQLEQFAATGAAEKMLAALDRQNEATLGLLLQPGDDRLRSDLAEAETEFRDALSETQGLGREQEELVAVLADRFPRYQELRDRVLERTAAEPFALYAREAQPAFEQVRVPVKELLSASRARLGAARKAVQDAAARGSAIVGVLVTAGLLAVVGLTRSMHVHVLYRLDELTRFSEAIAVGQHHERAALKGEDELSQLARLMNEMLDHRADLEGRLEGRLAQERQLLLGLLEQLGAPALLYTRAGDLIASTADRLPPETLSALAVHLGSLSADEVAGKPPRTWPAPWSGPGGARASVEPVVVGRERPVGWLARLAPA